MRFFFALKRIVCFELLWRLAFLCLVNPLFSGLFHAYVSAAGLSLNGGIVWAFLHPVGAAVFLLLFFATAWLVFYEYSVVIRTAALYRQGESFTLGQAMKAALWDLRLLRGWGLIPGAVYFVLLLPLVGAVYVSGTAPRVTIPWFIFGELQKSWAGVAGGIAIQAGYYLAHLLLLFVPVVMVLRQRRFGQAAGDSLRCWRQLGWRERMAVLAVYAGWNWAYTEQARYWRRNVLTGDDFNGDFLKYLLFNEAFQKDLLWWLLLVLLQAAAMAGAVWLLASVLAKTGEAQATRCPAWDADGAAVWEIVSRRWAAFAGRWRGRMKKLRWRAGAAAVCLTLIAGLLLGMEHSLLVHAPIVLAHRGGAGGIENTRQAVFSAMEQGTDYAEIDVQLTKDGVPVLFHDGNLWRMAGRAESVGELTWAELQEIPVSDKNHPGETGKIASLEEVLSVLACRPGMGLLIELKPEAGTGDALAQAIIQLVERYEFGRRAMFMSLDYLCLLPIMEQHPEWWVGCCAYGAAGDIDDVVWRYQVDFLAVEEALVSYRLVTRAREVNLPLYVWSVYDAEKMEQYLEMGISGIITDFPEEALAVRQAYRDSHPGAEYIWREFGLPRKEEWGSW